VSAPIRVKLPRDLTAGRLARAVIAEHAETHIDAMQLATAKLLATELANNAVIHGRGEIGLEFELDDNRLRIAISDEGTGFERAVDEAGLSEIDGHGLRIVEAEASRWGIHEGTTHVWFELERTGPRLPSG
jgi:anti-sigma regulatory factor (Ser/Thr protein kinase)